MGCGAPSKPVYYGTRLPSQREGESEIVVSSELTNDTYNNETLADSFLATVEKHGNRPFYGTREFLKDGTRGKYQWKTYKEIYENSRALGSSIRGEELAPLIEDDMPIRCVGVHSKNREEYVTLVEACVLYSVTLVPLYDTLGPNVVEYILDHTRMTTVFCSAEAVQSVLGLAAEGKANQLKNVVLFEEITDDLAKKAKDGNLNLLSFQDLIKKGRENAAQPILPKPDDVYYISYTSGTTGTPKAAVLTHKNIYTNISSSLHIFDVTHEDVYISYLPLAHMAEGTAFQMMVRQGVAIGVYSGDPRALVGDLAELKPTVFGGVPRVYNRFYDMIRNKLREATGKKKKVADMAIETKMKNYKAKGTYKHAVYDKLVFSKIKAVLGGRVRMMLTGAAPIHPEVLCFLKICFCAKFYEVYGGTEVGGVGSASKPYDPVLGHIGSVPPGIQAKLLSIPELNYHVTDYDVEGNSCPRGELCLKGNTIFKGYYRDPERTKEALDAEGWLHTGDIAALDQFGRLKIIDRKKAIFKLSQGEYVAPEKVESVYALCRFVGQCWVYGDSLRDYTVAVVVPDEDTTVKESKAKLKLEGNLAQLVARPEVKQMILDDLTEVGKEAGLTGFERVKNISLQSEMFSPENVLTPTLKLRRNIAKEHFGELIEKLYSEKI